MTDAELLNYCYWHCRTDLGQTHKIHVVRLLTLAGVPTDHLDREWYFLDPETVDPLVAAARARLASAGSSPSL